MYPRDMLFTLEFVTEGHPDKLCDQISDTVLGGRLRLDPGSRVACNSSVYGTAKLSDATPAQLVRRVFPLSPRGMIDHLKPRAADLPNTAAYGHFRREDVRFPWERVDAVDELKAKAKCA